MAKYKPQIRQDETTVVDLDLCAKYDGEGNDIVETYAKKGESGGGGGVPVIDLGESTLTGNVVTGTLSDEDYSTIVNSDFSVLKITKSTDNTIHYFAYSTKQGLGYTFVESFSSSYIVVMSTKMWAYTQAGSGLYRHYVTGGYTTPRPQKAHYTFEFTINNSHSTALKVSDFTSTTMVIGYSYQDTGTSQVDGAIMSVSPTSTTGYLGIKTYNTLNV